MTDDEIRALVAETAQEEAQKAVAAMKQGGHFPRIQITDEQQAMMKRVTEEAVAKGLQKLPEQVEQVIQKSIMGALGLTMSYGKYELSNCDSILGSIITRYATALADEVAPPILQKVVAKAVENKTFLKTAAERMRYAFINRLEHELTDAARRYADQQVKYVFQQIDKIDLKNLMPKNVDPMSPFSFDTQIGEIIIEELARRMANGEAIPDQIK
jgi:oligoribonuclease NrnB/cAMP/cGMP phosphodiesterase (DHH superfamily)